MPPTQQYLGQLGPADYRHQTPGDLALVQALALQRSVADETQRNTRPNSPRVTVVGETFPEPPRSGRRMTAPVPPTGHQ
jgi:hypothetical protein